MLCCSDCGRLLPAQSLHLGLNRVLYCPECWGEIFALCEHCGALCYRAGMQCYQDAWLCCCCYAAATDDAWWHPTGFKGRQVYFNFPSRRRFGVEIETARCPDYEDLTDDAVWGCKSDASITGLEFVSDILFGDDGLIEIYRICDFAQKHGWSVDRRCGLHIHLDMWDEPSDRMQAIALAYLLTYEVWASFVDPVRRASTYCKPCRATIDDIAEIENWDNFSSHQDRHEWINFHAFCRHGSFEVRLHPGSIDGKEIVNWVTAHAVFMDWAANAGWDGVKNALDTDDRWKVLADIWQDAGCHDLVDYYHQRSLNFCGDTNG